MSAFIEHHPTQILLGRAGFKALPLLFGGSFWQFINSAVRLREV